MIKKKEKTGGLKRFFIFLFTLLLLVTGAFAWWIAFRNNVNVGIDDKVYLYIPKNTNYNQLLEIIKQDKIISDINSFDWYAKRMKLNQQIIPGKYRIIKGMDNRQIVKMLKNGKEEKITLTINYTTRSINQLKEKLYTRFNISEEEMEMFLANEELINRKYGLGTQSVSCLIRPGKYELSWALETEDIFDLMYEKYSSIWTSERLKKSKKINLSQAEIITLASIVDCESKIESEQKKIAGVYLNRLEKNMALQADPTVIFAIGNFNIQRLSFEDLKIDSPYNTYKYKGLPPGPVSFPTEKAIESVLNYEKNNYLFFCAKPELNGYSNFSATFEEHLKYADAYRKALDKRGINRN
jgi:UPF0755 protein